MLFFTISIVADIVLNINIDICWLKNDYIL